MEDRVEYATTKKTGNAITLSASFSAEEVSTMRREALAKEAGRLRVPGFRPGKAPVSIVAKYVMDEELKEDIIRKAASQAYLTFLKEHQETEALIFEPEVIRTSWAETDSTALGVDVCIYELPATDTAFWKDVEIEDVPIDVAPAVRRRLLSLVEAVTEVTPKDGPAQPGDSVNVSILTLKATKPYKTELTVGEGEVGKAYQEVLAGMKAGESKHFTVTIQDSQLEGDITVENVCERHVPEMDDEFARSVGSYDTLAELEKTLTDDEERKARIARDDTLFERAMKAASEKLNLEFPMYVRTDATDRRMEEIKSSLTRNGLSLSDYLKYNNIGLDQLRTDVEADAVAALQRDLLMEATQRVCVMSASDADVEAYVTQHGEELGKAAIDVTTEKGRASVRNIVIWDMTRELIVKSVRLGGASTAPQKESE